MTERRLKVHGPFTITRELLTSKKKADRNAFWESSEELKALRGQCGVYFFGVSAGGSIKPWYVGKTVASFETEVFTAKNRCAYLSVFVSGKQMKGYSKGRPVIFLLAYPKGSVSGKIVREVEVFFINEAYRRNSKIANVRDIEHPKWSIRGVIRSKGKPSEAARDFRQMMGYD